MPRLYDSDEYDDDLEFSQESSTAVKVNRNECLWINNSQAVVFIKKQLVTGIWRLDILFVTADNQFEAAIGIAKNTWVQPSKPRYLGCDKDSIDFNSNGNLYHVSPYGGNKSWRNGDVIGCEVHFLVNGVMQSVGVSDIPLPLKVGVCSQYVHMGMRIVNFHRISESEVTPLPPKYTYVSFNT